MPVDRILGALAGLVLGVALFVGGGAIVYVIFFVGVTGRALGLPPLLFDHSRMTDFGPELTPLGITVYGAIWFAPFVVAGAACAPWVRRVVRG